MSAFAAMPIVVTDHAMWQAAERFPRFDTARIEGEIRAAVRAGRITHERARLGLHDRYDGTSLYVWTEAAGGRWRVYAIRVDRHDGEQWVVLTTMATRRAA